MTERDMQDVGNRAGTMLLERINDLSLPPRRVPLNSRVVLRGPVPRILAARWCDVRTDRRGSPAGFAFSRAR